MPFNTCVRSHIAERAKLVVCILSALFCGVALLHPASATGDPNRPEDYAIALPVTIRSVAPLQRLTLPAQVMVASQSPGLNDVRVFNSAGQPVPMALVKRRETQTTLSDRVMTAMPLYGSVGDADSGTLSSHDEQHDSQRMTQSMGAIGAGKDSGRAPSGRHIVGALFDTRAVADPLVRAKLDVDLPAAQLISFFMETSSDLRNWTPLTFRVLYRPEESATRLDTDDFDLRGANIHQRYLRVTWRDEQDRPLSTVNLRGATLTTQRNFSLLENVTASVIKPMLADAHTVRVDLPFATTVSALTIRPAGDNQLIPVRILTRADNEQPWKMLAQHVLYEMATADNSRLSAPIRLHGDSARQLRIEASRNTAGFVAAPAIEVAFEPVDLVFLAHGVGPHTLVAGMRGVSSPFLPIGNFYPDYRPGQETVLPQADVDLTGVPDAIVVGNGDCRATSVRSIMLWAVLVAGVAALGLIAWQLLKQNPQPSHV